MGRQRKHITTKEKLFADYIVDHGLGSIEAARKAFGWRCEPGSAESRKAVSLKRSPRIKQYIEKKQEVLVREAEASEIVKNVDSLEWDQIRKFAFERLQFIRDDETIKSQVRFNAIQALEKLADPSSDMSLIYSWLDLLWRGSNAHCPSCHKSFPLAEIKNSNLNEWLHQHGDAPPVPVYDLYDRRMQIIGRTDRGKAPHNGQVRALAAKERHVVITAAARSGKSLLLAWMATLYFLIPGVEIWVLARIYEDARSEVTYLKRFLSTLFYPFSNKLIKETFDSKTGELTLTSRWGSEVKVKSAKAKGSITGRELEAALVAEPGWVPDDVFEELRARMSSRLGRIFMMGTPKGFGGILGRMLNITYRDPKTGKMRKMGPEERTLSAGSPWGTSLLYYKMHPSDNPEYVKSELESAKVELLEHEYASEFEGEISTQVGAKFPNIKDHHLQTLDPNKMLNCQFVLGVDQGPKNFAAVLIGYDGTKVYVINEYFEMDSRTMKFHMNVLRQLVPTWIAKVGGADNAWKLTIFDADPPVLNEISEFELEGKKWPTDVTFRPKGQGIGNHNRNWRSETYEFVNALSSLDDANLIFNIRTCELLHDQMKRIQSVPEVSDRDNVQASRKFWLIRDPWRGDHCADALVFALWTIISHQLVVEINHNKAPGDPWDEAKAAQEYAFRVNEQKDLTGNKFVNRDQVFENVFGRNRGSLRQVLPKGVGHYDDY